MLYEQANMPAVVDLAKARGRKRNGLIAALIINDAQNMRH